MNKTVGEFVAENIKTAHIFKEFGIDFCCGGGISVARACEKNSVDYDSLISALNQVEQETSRAYDYNSWELDFLIDHITHIHHSYVNAALPLLIEYSDKVASVHGSYYTEQIEVNKLIHLLREDLLSHMMKEEHVLFPYVKELVAASKGNASLNKPVFGTVKNPISMMEEEHETAGSILKQLSDLTNQYTLPEGACNTFRALYSKLEEFESDLHQHIHLENNILFPKAKLLEAKVLNL